MAKFGEKLFDVKDVLKSKTVPVSCAGGQWFVNVGKISVVNVRDQKILHTWTLTHPHYFTSSVVHSDGNLYCAMDKKVLMKWSVEEDDLKNAEKFKFQDSIFTVISANENQPLVIFDSGKCAVINSSFHDTKVSDFTLIKENEKLIWADACVSARDIEVFFLVHNQKNQKRILYSITIDKENSSEPLVHSHEISHKEASLKSWCLNHHSALILSFWSDGTIYSHNVKESIDLVLLSIKDTEENTLIDIDSINSIHIVISRTQPNQEECILEIWDSKCAILKAQKVLKTPSVNSVQIVSTNSNMFLCINNELLAVPYNIDDPTFFAALGMSESNKCIQHSWSTDLDLIQIPANDEPENMDVCFSLDSLDLIDDIAEKLLNENSPDIMCIPEFELIQLLQLAIRHKKEENSGKKNFDKKMYILLNIIFSAPFNDVLLLKYLKRMNLEETLIALNWLLTFLNHTVNIPSNVLQRPSDLQIVNWTCLIIQSHTEALLFSKDKASRKLMKQLEKTLSVKMEEYEDFDCIQSYFTILEKKNILPQTCSVAKYCIENLEI